MLSPDENKDEEVLSPNDMRVEGGSGEEEEELDSSKSSGGSKRSRGPSGEKSIPTNTEENAPPELGITRTPLEVMLKGLIVSQMRSQFVEVEEGIINLVRECLLAEQPNVTSASLSGHVDHFQSVYDLDLGWGCGWRNIQILCSFLLVEDPEVREVLFNGAGFVPDIAALQTWLEIAWGKGFDLPGAEFFGWGIAGTRKWIGTTECAALLRSFGVRAKIVSFTAMGVKRVRGGLESKHSELPLIDLKNDDEQVKGSLDMLSDRVMECSRNNSQGEVINSGRICEHGAKDRGNVNEDSVSYDNRGKAKAPDRPFRKGALQLSESGVSFDKSRGNPKDAKDTEPGDTCEKYVTYLGDQEPPSFEYKRQYVCDGGRKPIERMTRNFELCSSCQEVDKYPTKETGSREGYFITEGNSAIRNCGPPVKDQQRAEDSDDVDEGDGGMDQDETSEGAEEDSVWVDLVEEKVGAEGKQPGGNTVEENNIGREDQMTESPQIATRPQQKKSQQGAGSKPKANGERRKAGMQGSSSEGENDGSSVNHRHLIQWIWSYFTESSTQSVSGSSDYSRHFVNMSRRS